MTEVGHIYVFWTAAMPDIVKIGKAKNFMNRLRDANSTDAYKPPSPFVVVIAIQIENYSSVESSIHTFLKATGKHENYGGNREWFRMSREEAVKVVTLFPGKVLFPLSTDIKTIDTTLYTEITAKKEELHQLSVVTLNGDDLAYRLFRECLNAEKRVGEYTGWINCAKLLKNIADTEKSYSVWTELTRRVNPSHKKTSYSDTQFREKWKYIRVDEYRKLGMGSLHKWSREDNKEKYESIQNELITNLILQSTNNTEESVALIFYKMYMHDFRWCGPKNQWYQYDKLSNVWKSLNTKILQELLYTEVRKQYLSAEHECGNKSISADSDNYKWLEKKRTYHNLQGKLEKSNFLKSVIRLCQEKFYDDEFVAKLNSNPFVLGVANGVLDLRNHDENGKPCVLFRDSVPEDNISFQMGRNDPDMDAIPYEVFVPSNPTPTHKLVLEFFERIYPDPILREYVMTLLSSCLEGTNKEQRFYVMQGKGSNGKSMISTLMELTFGDYGTSVSTKVFTRKKPESEVANPDVIAMKKRRYIHTGDLDDNEKINTTIMKQYTGGDRITARGLFADQEKFSITGKIFMSCNDLPPVSKTDNGTWRRIRVIPHVSTFKDPGDPAINPTQNVYEKDMNLEHKVRHWRTAFLGILVWYYQEHYLTHGLKEPASVRAASDKYKEESDMFMQFIGETFVLEENAGPVSNKEFRSLFTVWKKAQGKACEMTIQQAIDRMKELCKKNSNANEFWGVRVAQDGEDIGPAFLATMP